MKKIMTIESIIVLAVVVVTLIIMGQNFKENNNTKEMSEIQVIVYGKEGSELYNEKKVTEAEILLDALEEMEEMELVTESGPYGAYITSIKGELQSDGYYWTYYVSGEYAPVGIESYKVKDNDVYEFKLERF